MKEKMWSILVHLGPGMGLPADKRLTGKKMLFDDNMWDMILKRSEDCGINTIVLDVGDGIEYATHPEISAEGAWTKTRLKKEIKRCEELGIKLIPKLNFSAMHDNWLGYYNRMLSTPQYYRVCSDLIKEVYEAFMQPEYIHIGMDEESAEFCNSEFNCFRTGNLYWHDMRFLVDCVEDTGAKAWIWSNPLFDHPEEYKKHFAPDELLISPYHYNALRKDHYTPIESRSEYMVYYNEGKYAEMGIKFVEEDPYLVHFMEVALPLMKEGYLYVPCASVFNRCKYNHDDLLEYFRNNAPDEQIIGYMTAPWYRTTKEYESFFIESFDDFKAAKEKFYK